MPHRIDKAGLEAAARIDDCVCKHVGYCDGSCQPSSAIDETGIKSCPFCGGEATREELTDEDNFGGSVICCTQCGASSPVHFDRKENLIDSWNRRASTTSAGVTEEQVEAACDAFTSDWPTLEEFEKEHYRKNMRAALEASRVAPVSQNEAVAVDGQIKPLEKAAQIVEVRLTEALTRRHLVDLPPYLAKEDGDLIRSIASAIRSVLHPTPTPVSAPVGVVEEVYPAGTKRVCPKRDATCPHGMGL